MLQLKLKVINKINDPSQIITEEEYQKGNYARRRRSELKLSLRSKQLHRMASQGNNQNY